MFAWITILIRFADKSNTRAGGDAVVKHVALKKQALKRPGVRAAYDALGPEFDLLNEMLAARTRAGLTQADVAELMGTHAPAITRLESALSSSKHSPSIDTLKRYAHAVGCELSIRMRPRKAGVTKRAREGRKRGITETP